MRLIDADRLLEERRIHTYYHLPNGDISIPLIDIKNAPTIMPSVQPERKRGRWMLSEMYESDHVAMICSECGATYDKTVAGGLFNYCPSCGADMRGKTDETD